MKHYYWHDGKSEKGPFELEELKKQPISKNTLIWFEGLDEWKKAGELEELKDLFKATRPPLPSDNTSSDKEEQEPRLTTSKDNKSSWKALWIFVLLIVGGSVFYFYSQNAAESKAQMLIYENEANKLRMEEERIEREKMLIRNNWKKYIQVTRSTYEYNALFGGISDLSMEVYNDTDYPIDQVEILVDYIRNNGDNYKTEKVIVYNVPAHGKTSERAPDSNKGVRIEYKVLSISSRKLDFCYSMGNWSQNSEDPFKCK